MKTNLRERLTTNVLLDQSFILRRSSPFNHLTCCSYSGLICMWCIINKVYTQFDLLIRLLLCSCFVFHVKGVVHPKMYVIIIYLMWFQIQTMKNAFVHLRNTNEDISNEM